MRQKEKTFLQAERSESAESLDRAREVRRVDAVRTISATFDNPVWQLQEELEEPRPFRLSDFVSEPFIPNL